MRATTASLEGYLESPGPWHPATGSLVVAGWVFSRERPIRGVELAIDGGAPVALAYGVQRTDVERRHPRESSRASGFGALVPLADPTQRVVRIELFVTFDDGRRMPWMERDVRLYEAGPVARLTRVASIVMNAARTAISTRRLPPEPGTRARTLQAMLHQLDPKSPIPSNGFCAIALLMHQPEQARAHFLEALRLDAANVRARQALAAMAEQPPADYREALRLCQEIQQLAPRTPGNDDCIRRNQERLAAQPANGR